MNYNASLTLSKDETHIWSANLDLNEKILAEFWQFLSEDEKARATRYKFEIHRKRFIAAKGILRILLARYLRVSPEEIAFGFGEHGKPFIKNPKNTGIFFNSSDSKNMAVYAITQQEIGVDIEFIREEIQVIELAERFFSQDEKTALAQFSGQMQLKAFFSCWARKEAFIKYLGKGLYQALNKFSVTIDPEQDPKLWYADNAKYKEPCLLYDLQISPDFASALAVGRPTKISQFIFDPEQSGIKTIN